MGVAPCNVEVGTPNIFLPSSSLFTTLLYLKKLTCICHQCVILLSGFCWVCPIRDQQEIGKREEREVRLFVSLLPQYEATVGWHGLQVITFSRCSLYMTLSCWVPLTAPSFRILVAPCRSSNTNNPKLFHHLL